jgi:hypothetical protein
LTTREPNDFPAIGALRGPGPRHLWATWNEDVCFERLEGARYGRMAGCALGVAGHGLPGCQASSRRQGIYGEIFYGGVRLPAEGSVMWEK